MGSKFLIAPTTPAPACDGSAGSKILANPRHHRRPMASLKKTLAKAMSGHSTPEDGGSDPELDESSRRRSSSSADKYLLQVTAGPSYDVSTHQVVLVNGDDDACTSFENEFLRAKLRVRVRDYTGLPETAPKTSSYFSDPSRKHDLYSISFSFVPKVNLPSQDMVWGNDFDHSIRDRLPPGFNTAFKIVKQFIDPGLECDAYADQPWLLGPALSCWFVFRVGEQGNNAKPQDLEIASVLHEGADGSGMEAREANGIPDAQEKRRKHFLTDAHRQGFEFEKGRLYQGDFYNPYIDFGNFSLKLPGFSLNVIRYINDKTHTLRYVFKNKVTGDVYFVVVFTLLFGREIDAAVEEAKSRKSLEVDPNGVD